MEKILTLKEIKEFINNNKSNLDKDSTVILTQDNHFSFIKNISFLNLEGVYDWVMDNGELLEGKHGDVMTLQGESYGTFTPDEISNRKADTHEDFFHNFVFSNYDSYPKNLETFEKELEKYQGDNNPDKKVIITGIMKDHCVATDIKIYDTDITFDYHDSYGHKVSMSPTKTILAIECEIGIKQKFNPSKSKRNESIIIRFNDFINECKDDDLYKDSLDDNYWKTISYKFPEYNDPNSDDHEKAVDYILYNMKKKYKDEDWKEIENNIRDKISAGIA